MAPCLQHEEALAVFFFNEINRARPQAHGLLLHEMAERSVNLIVNIIFHISRYSG